MYIPPKASLVLFIEIGGQNSTEILDKCHRTYGRKDLHTYLELAIAHYLTKLCEIKINKQAFWR